jgi:hypothetical protein
VSFELRPKQPRIVSDLSLMSINNEGGSAHVVLRMRHKLLVLGGGAGASLAMSDRFDEPLHFLRVFGA